MAATLQFQAPHREAAEFLRGKPALARAVFDQLLPELRARAFTVTGLEGANALERLRDEIAALPEGKPWDEVKGGVVDALAPHLGEGAERRAELLLRIHGFQAFQAATWRAAQLDSDTTHLQYLTMEDARVRPAHAALDGVILPKDDPFWETHTPPWDWGCRCRIRPMNPDLVELTRRRDAAKPPEQQRVLEGPVLEQLRHGTRITPEGQRVDVTPPSAKPGGEQAFAWNPRDLELDLETLRGRYTPEVWAAFADWASKTEIAPGVTVYQWLSQPAVLSRVPEAAQSWKQLGLPPAREWRPSPPPLAMDAEDSRQRLRSGVLVEDPTGRKLRFSQNLVAHWELESAKRPEDVQRRLQLLPEAMLTVRDPAEIWDHGHARAYLRRSGEVYFVALFAAPTGEVRTYFATRNEPYVNRLRRGTRLWPN